ncbi:MAG: YaaR family protein [Spirochaetaceae bacterium]
MEISNLNGFNQIANESSFKSQKKEKIKDLKSKRFSFELNRAKESNNLIPSLTGEEELTELMDKLFANGELLVKDPTISNLRSYRSSMSLFFKFVIKNSLNFDSIEGRLNPKTFERKCYALVTVVDKKIDNIAKNVLGDQRKQFDLLGAVEELNGLIVDLIS